MGCVSCASVGAPRNLGSPPHRALRRRGASHLTLRPGHRATGRPSRNPSPEFGGLRGARPPRVGGRERGDSGSLVGVASVERISFRSEQEYSFQEGGVDLGAGWLWGPTASFLGTGSLVGRVHTALSWGLPSPGPRALSLQSSSLWEKRTSLASQEVGRGGGVGEGRAREQGQDAGPPARILRCDLLSPRPGRLQDRERRNSSIATLTFCALVPEGRDRKRQARRPQSSVS